MRKLNTQQTYVLVTVALCVVTWYFTKSHYNVNQTTSQVKEVATTHTVIKETRSKDGSSVVLTTIDSKTNLDTKVVQTSSFKPPRNTIVGLVGNDFSKSIPQPIYGVSVSREFLGPVNLGVWGLTNSIVGVSVGISF